MAADPVNANAIPAVATADHPIQNNNQVRNNNQEGGGDGGGSPICTAPPSNMSQYFGWVTGTCMGSKMVELLKNDSEMMKQLEESGMKPEEFEPLFQGVMGEMMKDASDLSIVAEDDDEEKSAISSMFE
jgi:hypothetical protein